MGSASDKSYLSPDLQITGEIRSEGDIEVNGVIEGEISCRNLTIGQEAAFHGQAIADNVEVHGSLKGRIRAETVSLVNTANVEGDILHRSLSIEPGAVIEGTAQRLGAEDKQPARSSERNDLRASDKAGSQLQVKAARP